MTYKFSGGRFIVLSLGLLCVILGTRSFDLIGITWKNMICLFTGVLILYFNSVIVEENKKDGKKEKRRK